MITVLAACGALLGAANGALAGQSLAQTFAACSGRLSAEVEHAWLLQDPAADVLAHQRKQFRDILAAIDVPHSGSEMLGFQIEAKFAQASLLKTATFGTDERRKRLARTYAQVELSRCESMLFDS